LEWSLDRAFKQVCGLKRFLTIGELTMYAEKTEVTELALAFIQAGTLLENIEVSIIDSIERMQWDYLVETFEDLQREYDTERYARAEKTKTNLTLEKEQEHLMTPEEKKTRSDLANFRMTTKRAAKIVAEKMEAPEISVQYGIQFTYNKKTETGRIKLAEEQKGRNTGKPKNNKPQKLSGLDAVIALYKSDPEARAELDKIVQLRAMEGITAPYKGVTKKARKLKKPLTAQAKGARHDKSRV
jgi:hypothetical protein